MPPKKLELPPHTRKLLDAALTGGLDVKRAARAFGASQSATRKARPYSGAANGLVLSAAQLGLTLSELERRITSEYRAGETTAGLAGCYHTSFREIQRVLIKHDCPIRSTGRPSGLELLRRVARAGAAFASETVLSEAYARARRLGHKDRS